MAIKYNTKAIVTIPAWAEALHEGTGVQRDTINSAAAAYAFVPLVNRAVRLRADSLISTPLYFTKLDGETEVPAPFDGLDWKDLIWKTEAALCLQGANYIERMPRAMSKKTGALKWINPVTVTTRLIKRDDGAQVYEFQQGTGGGAKWTADEMIYMREFSLLGEIAQNGSILPGDSAAKVALNDAALIRYMSRFAARFFETGAMPITVLQIDGIVDKDEASRIEGFFKKAATRIRNAFNVLALSRAIEPKVISQPLKDLVMPELNAQARHAVSLAFGIPQTMLEDAANFATSKEHRLSFWQDTMRPRGEWIAAQFNRQLLNGMGIQMYFGFEELDIFQEDENERAASLGTIVTAINTNPAIAKWAMGILGYDLSAEQEQEFEKLAAKPEPPPETPTPPPAETVPELPVAKAAWADDLARWERKALRVLKESDTAVCAFESENIPRAVRTKIETALPECKTADSIRELFAVKQVAQTPAPDDRDGEIVLLADALNRFADAAMKAAPPQPNINVTLPPITMTANMPETKEPSITFSPVIEQPVNNIEIKAADQPPAQVTFAPVIQPSSLAIENKLEQQINVQPAENVNEINVQPADVKIDVPKPKRERQKIKRGKDKLITETDTTIEYEE